MERPDLRTSTAWLCWPPCNARGITFCTMVWSAVARLRHLALPEGVLNHLIRHRAALWRCRGQHPDALQQPADDGQPANPRRCKMKHADSANCRYRSAVALDDTLRIQAVRDLHKIWNATSVGSLPWRCALMKLTGKHVLVTGGSSGIGLALARRLIKRGASVTLIARTPSKLQAAVEELQVLVASYNAKPGAPMPRVQSQAADVTDLEQVGTWARGPCLAVEHEQTGSFCQGPCCPYMLASADHQGS